MKTHPELCRSVQRTQPSDRLDHESSLVSRFVLSTRDAGISVNPITIINLYISLKSKPFVILVGSESSKKRRLIEILVKILTNNDPSQSQFMLGHAWGAEQSENVTLFTHDQMQFNIEKFFTLVEEAQKLGNKDEAFFACLDRISPAEVLYHYSELSNHIQHRKDHLVSSLLLSVSKNYPPNFFSIGLMDVRRFSWYDEGLLSQTNVIYWRDGKDDSDDLITLKPSLDAYNGKAEWLGFCVKDEEAAYLKLLEIIKELPNALFLLLEVEKILIEHGVEFSSRSVTNEVVIYLANAWTKNGNGLFSPSTYRNLEIALDIAISQIVLPRGWMAYHRSVDSRHKTRELFSEEFAFSRNFLNQLESKR